MKLGCEGESVVSTSSTARETAAYLFPKTQASSIVQQSRT